MCFVSGLKTVSKASPSSSAQIPHWVDHLPCGWLEIDSKWRIRRLNNLTKELFERAEMPYPEVGVLFHQLGGEVDWRTVEADLRKGGASVCYPNCKNEPGVVWQLKVCPSGRTVSGESGYFLFIDEKVTHDSELNRLRELELNLRQSLLTRETLLSILSHDLRAPIFQLQTLLFLIEQSAEKKDFRKIGLHAHDLQERIFHLTNFLENLLRWSSRQGKELVLQKEAFDLIDAINSVKNLFEPLIKTKHLMVRIDFPPQVSITTDRELVLFIIRNLLSNAIKYSKKGGEIEMKIACVDNVVEFSIRDFGTGLDDQTLEAIEDPERYFTKPGTSGEQGTGLGLKLCFQFVRLLNGELKIQPGEDRGTRVILRI